MVEDESTDLIGRSVASYVCVCNDGFTGKNCEIGKVILSQTNVAIVPVKALSREVSRQNFSSL